MKSATKRYIIQLTDGERAALEAMVGRGQLQADRARRAPLRWRITNADARSKLCRLYPSRGA